MMGLLQIELWLMIGFVIVASVIALILSERPIPHEKIARVELLDTKDSYRTGYEKDGFSWGNDGFRTYYSKKTHFAGTYGHFRVTFKNGNVRNVWSRAGTEQCKGLVAFIKQQEAEAQKQEQERLIQAQKKREQEERIQKRQEQLKLNSSAVNHRPNVNPSVASKATILGAGTYTFGKNIPDGMYDLIAVKGTGWLTLFDYSDDELTGMSFGVGDGDAKEYRGLNSDEVQKFVVEDDVEFEIKKAQMVNIE